MRRPPRPPVCMPYTIQYWQGQSRVNAKVRPPIGIAPPSSCGIASRGLAFTQCCHSLYCMAYIAMHGGRGETIYCANVCAMKGGSGVPRQRRSLQSIVLIRAHKPQNKPISRKGQPAASLPNAVHPLVRSSSTSSTSTSRNIRRCAPPSVSHLLHPAVSHPSSCGD